MLVKIVKRGSPPLGGGEVHFVCPVITSLNNVNFSDPGRIKRIRGIAAVTRISPQASNRLVESARSLLNAFIPDIYIYSDVYKGEEAGLYTPLKFFVYSRYYWCGFFVLDHQVLVFL